MPLPGGGDPASLYVDGYGDEWIRSESEMAAKSRFRLHDIARLCPAPARVLDVGCSAGWMLDMLTEAGYRAEESRLIEAPLTTDARAAAPYIMALSRIGYLGAKLGLAAYESCPGAPCDLNSMIARVTRLLAPGGVLLIYVPNFLSLPARLLKNKWGFTPRHRSARGGCAQGARRGHRGRPGIPAVICNGVRAGALEAALAGKPEGTRFHPGPTRHNSFKLWLLYAKPAHGTLVIDAGATRALREQGTSLLPVGVVEVRGEFDAGDAVEIAEPGGVVIAKGLCNYSALELRRARGLQSEAVREILPHATDEAVHGISWFWLERL